MRLLTYTVAPEQEGWPLRRLLRQELRISGSFLSRLKWRPGAILLNGQPATVAALVRAGDTVTADVSDLPGDNPHIRPVDYPLDILWEDQDLLILNKPAGIAIHPAALTEETVTVAGAVCRYLGQGSFHCVNRLDRGTTGVMAVAKTGYVHRLCMEQLHSGDFRRTYLAVCRGCPDPAAGSIDPAGLAAHTDYETLWQGPDRALLRLTPGTGRTHQLRLHLSAIGHPLLGDWLYGQEDRDLIPRPALHSHRLELTHPVTRRRLTVTAPLPEDMARLLPEDMNKS